MVISIGNGVNDPNSLSEFGGGITFNWARRILKSMDSVKRKGITGKVELSAQFLAEEKFTFQRAISTVVCNHDIAADLVIKLLIEHLFHTYPLENTHSTLKVLKTFP